MQKVRGTQDFLPQQSALYRRIDDIAYELAQRYGYGQIQTPLMETSEVFHRTLGETSDVVSKETYTFQDRGGDSVTLRPEGTAGIARAFISEGLQQNLPLKLYYSGAMFRYERPQKGRFRQFHQIGVECLGIPSASADVEVIMLGYQFLEALNLNSRSKLQINTLGDSESRNAYRQKVVDYFSKYTSELSADSQTRLQKNPLRIFDSKDANDQKLAQGAPKLDDSLNNVSREFFDKVQEGLTKLAVPHERNSHLVRGLDYYSHTVFEIVTTELGAQGTLLAGGRYDGLMEIMGGPATAGVGWAAGIERLMELCAASIQIPSKKKVAVLPFDSNCEIASLQVAQLLRKHGHQVEIIYSPSQLGKKMKKADSLGCSEAYILGEDEIKSQEVTFKNLSSGDQKKIPWSQL
ncbi:MAG: histidine--tRNA ligase [Bdellovibrionota bacterium]